MVKSFSFYSFKNIIHFDWITSNSNDKIGSYVRIKIRSFLMNEVSRELTNRRHDIEDEVWERINEII